MQSILIEKGSDRLPDDPECDQEQRPPTLAVVTNQG